MTKREAAIVSAYTGFMLGEFSDMHRYIEGIMGRDVSYSELGDVEFAKKVRMLSHKDYISIDITE